MILRSVVVGACASAVLLAGCTAPQAGAPAPSTTLPTPSAPASSAVPSAAPTASVSGTPRVTPSRTKQPPEVRVRSVSNFRDVAGSGAGLAIGDGGHMRRGVVFRSGKLQPLSAADERALVAAGVTDVFDLRTDAVARRSPDPSVGRARYHLVNVFAVYSRVDPFPSSVRAARIERERMNRDFVADPKQRKRIGALLRDIAGARGAVIVHCTEGKDRTGWVSAMLQLIAGVDRPAVMREYLMSNERRSAIIERGVAQALAAKGRTAAEITRARLEVRRSYLDAGFDELVNRYGDLHGYLTEGLGLSDRTVDRLQAKLAA